MSGSSSICALLVLGASIGPPPPPPVEDSSAQAAREAPKDEGDVRELALSEALEAAASANPTLAAAGFELEASEARILQAMGAFDLTLVASTRVAIDETPQRGSQFALQLSRREIGGNVGFERLFSTGTRLELGVDLSLGVTTQPIDLTDAARGSATFGTYRIAPWLVLSQPLLRGVGARVNRAEVRKAEVARSVAEAQRQIVAQEIVSEILVGYAELSFAHQNLQDKRSAHELAQQQLERTERLVRMGRRTVLDRQAAQLDLANRRIALAKARQTHITSSAEMRRLMGQDLAEEDLASLLPTTRPPLAPSSPVLADELDRAMRANPRIRQLALLLAGSKVDLELASNARLPQLDAAVRFSPVGRSADGIASPLSGERNRRGSWGEAFRNFAADDIRNDGLLAEWSLLGTISLRWDLRNRTGKGRFQAARADFEAARAELEATRQRIATEVIEAVTSVSTSAEVLSAAEVAVEFARAALDGELSKFELGRTTNFDISLRLDDLQNARLERLRAHVDYARARVRLQALTAELLTSYGFTKDEAR